jgi:eukaryotic-like serine/threonine-protein kinase
MTPALAPPTSARTSRYATLLKLASGGMASVWVGTVRGGLGFRQIVAIKKPHPHLLEEADYRAELLAEAALASSIRHANVVDVRDVEVVGDDVSLVMDYIEGASLAELLTRSQSGGAKLLPAVAVRICLDALAGLHAAHELIDDRGRTVGLVHRDVSPQNILVGIDGLARVVDFGVAKFHKKDHSTTQGQLKGKIAYMAPEYLRNEPIDRRLDVFAMGVVLWEALTARRLFRGSHDVDTMQKVLHYEAPPVSELVPEARFLEPVIEAALAKDHSRRFQSAAAMAAALESSAREARLLASPRDVAAFVLQSYGADLAERRERIREKMVNEPSVASLFEGAKVALVDLGPMSLSPPTVKEPTRAPASGGPDLAATFREDGPAELAPNSAPLAFPATGALQGPAAAFVPAPAASELSLSAYDAASIPRPNSARWVVGGLSLAAFVLVVVVVALFSTRSSGPTIANPSAALPTPPVSAAQLVLPAVVPVSSTVPSTTTAPKASAVAPQKAAKPPPKPSGPPPNPYAH